MFLLFETSATQRRRRSNIEAKFGTFDFPSVKLKMYESLSSCQTQDPAFNSCWRKDGALHGLGDQSPGVKQRKNSSKI